MMRVRAWMAAGVVLAGVMAGPAAAAAGAQDWAQAELAKSPRHGEYVVIPEAGGRKLQAFVVYPERSTKAPVVVLVHEIFGESDWFKEMADELAAAGYIVVAPDLLSGWGPNQAAEKPMAGMGGEDHMHMAAGTPGAAYQAAQPGGTSAFPNQDAVVRAVTSLPDGEVLSDLDAAVDYGRKLPAAEGKVYVAGFCWGGGKAFLFATHRGDLSGTFVFYGPPPAMELMKNITAPVYGFYAQNDARISATVPLTTVQMKAAGKVYEPVIYDGAGHGFMRAGEAPNANAANSAARAMAYRRMVELLGGVR